LEVLIHHDRGAFHNLDARDDRGKADPVDGVGFTPKEAAFSYTDFEEGITTLLPLMDLSSLSPRVLLAGYCVLVLLASLAGGWFLLWTRLTHTRLQLATSFVAGMMLGVAILHLLPHAWHELQSIDTAAWWLLGGFLIMFFIQRFFHFHHHDVPEEAPERHPGHDHSEAEHCDHPDVHTLAAKSARHLSWGGAALGLTLHSLIDGVALAASVTAEAHATAAPTVVGVGTFLVVILHKPFDAMAIGTLMAAGGWSRPARHLVNFAFALAIPLGIGLFYLGAARFTREGGHFLGVALAFTAGSFLCIAASDLLPELQFHSHDRIKLSVALILGLALAALMGQLEGDSHAHHAGRHLHPSSSYPFLTLNLASSFLPDLRFVLRGREQALHFTGLAQFHPEKPAPIIGFVVHQPGIFDDSVVDFDHLAAHRRVNIARRLHRLYHGA
jgi:zinc and cadmium transporter